VAMRHGYPPLIAEISASLSAPIEKTQAALGRLAAGRALVLQPETGEILMANPFSAVPTPFIVEVSDFSCCANCIWDALGIPAMLHQDAHIKTACGDCGSALELQVVDDQVQGDPSIVHFAIPAHHWWDDIVFN
jgi:hypothetical protein